MKVSKSISEAPESRSLQANDWLSFGAKVEVCCGHALQQMGH